MIQKFLFKLCLSPAGTYEFPHPPKLCIFPPKFCLQRFFPELFRLFFPELSGNSGEEKPVPVPLLPLQKALSHHIPGLHAIPAKDKWSPFPVLYQKPAFLIPYRENPDAPAPFPKLPHDPVLKFQPSLCSGILRQKLQPLIRIYQKGAPSSPGTSYIQFILLQYDKSFFSFIGSLPLISLPLFL